MLRSLKRDKIQVINGINDQLIQNITLEARPNTIALNPTTNRIYVASPETDKIYLIDGLTNNITGEIQAGPLIGDMALDMNEFGGYSTLVFVSNSGNDSVSIIDDVKGVVVSNIKTGTAPFGIGVDTIKNRAYITTDYGFDVIDYTTHLDRRSVDAYHYENVTMGYFPIGIVDSNTSRAYMANSAANTVSVVDTLSNEELYEIKVGLFPNSIAFNPVNKMLYVSNTGNNTVSLLDSTIEKESVNSTKTKKRDFDR
jgi:YVTN family beta-propeller protein